MPSEPAELDRDSLLASVSMLAAYAYHIMDKKSKARGVSNLSDQGFAGVATRALSDKAARVKLAVEVDTFVKAADKVGYTLNDDKLPNIEWDKVFLDMLDISNYMLIACHILLTERLGGELPTDDD